ncbi:Hypothetical predicted protein [Mytilus galloprovincialis]|uniref:Uncharacterized protein n=1 Tax=Mytilus galloprovincialis TaxID=29158 RepID=A0A8B6CRV2_MYTGA|nr:Hypothetical predicted protein [Mytilus galloprovincialis]
MDEKVMCNRTDIQRSENLPDMQRKNILEIAGQQIIGDESGLSVEDNSSTDNNGQSSLREPLNVGKSVLELTTIFQIIENMCLKLNDYGEEFVMIMANPYKQTSNYIGSTEGRQFMKENTSVMQEFVKHCYHAACRLSTVKSGQETNPNIAEKVSSSEVKENQDRKDKQNNSAIKRTTIEFSDNNSETNGFESDVTENYDIEKIVQNAVQVVDKNLYELKSIEEENTLTNITPQNIKEYPHPKKRLTKMKVQEIDETNGSKTSKIILTKGISESPVVNKKMSKSKCIGKSLKQDKKNAKNKNNKFEYTKDTKGRRKDQRYVDIAIKPGYDVNLMMPQRNESLTMENVMPSANPNQSTDIGQLYPVQFTESSTFTDEVCSDTSSVINKGSQQASHAGSPIRVIDDSRHQFLMHQLTPVTSLIMESADGQQIQLPNEMYVMQLGLPDDSHVTNSNLINPTQAYSPNNDVMQANQTHNMHSYNKYL